MMNSAVCCASASFRLWAGVQPVVRSMVLRLAAMSERTVRIARMALGLVSRRLAERAVYFELILIFRGGVLGTGHHLYWVGGPSMWVPLGSMCAHDTKLELATAVPRVGPSPDLNEVVISRH